MGGWMDGWMNGRTFICEREIIMPTQPVSWGYWTLERVHHYCRSFFFSSTVRRDTNVAFLWKCDTDAFLKGHYQRKFPNCRGHLWRTRQDSKQALSPLPLPAPTPSEFPAIAHICHHSFATLSFLILKQYLLKALWPLQLFPLRKITLQWKLHCHANRAWSELLS